MIVFLKGLIIGIGKVIPGVSGSVLAISLNVYEKCIDIISNLFSEIKYNFKFMFFICLGILVSIIFGSKIIYWLIIDYYFLTMCFFLGLIGGTIPNLYKITNIKIKKDFLYVLIPCILMIMMSFIKMNNINIENNLNGYFTTLILGIVDAFSMIVPGISGTAIFIMFGTYEFILNLFANFMMPFIFFFILGVILGILIISKIINHCFKKYNRITYLVILGFMLSSFIFLIIKTYSTSFTLIEFMIGILLIIIGYFISIFLNNK